MPIGHTVKSCIAALLFAGIAIVPSVCLGQETGTSRVGKVPSAGAGSVRFGAGIGGGPGTLGGHGGWWVQAFGAIHTNLGRSWELVVEPGLMQGWSSIPPSGDPEEVAPGGGGLKLGDLIVSNRQDYRATMLVARMLFGYVFGEAFVLRAGPVTGYAMGTMESTHCGNATYTGVPAGFVIAPAFPFGRSGFELGLQAETWFVPLPRCRPGAETEVFSKGVVPRVEQSNEGHSSLSLRLSFVGF